MAGTRWVQKELLDKYPRANLSVYAVWFNMMPADSRSKWPANLLTDARVIHRWDEAKAVGHWFGARTPTMQTQLTADSAWSGNEVLWDAYLLYASDARWDDVPTHLMHWGRTIVAGRESLRDDLAKLFAP